MRKCIFSYLISVIPLFTFGQVPISDFLKSYQTEEAVNFQSSKLNSLNQSSFNLAYVEKLEFRTETNEFDWRKQEFLVRASPNSRKHVKTQRQYQKTVSYITQMELAIAKNQALRKRYDLIVDVIYLKEILSLKNKYAQLLSDKVTLLRRSISLADFDVMELIEAEDDVQKNVRETMDIMNAIITTDNSIQRIFPLLEEKGIENVNFITVNDIKLFLKKSNISKVVHPQLEVQSGKVYNKMLEYEWEVAKTKFSLGFVQAQYGYDSNDNFRKSFSIGIGFDIPFKSMGRIELNELEISIHENESEFRNLKNEISEGRFRQRQELENLIRKYDLVNQQLKEGQSEYALKEYQKIAEAPPKAIVKLRENTLRTELLLKTLEYNIVQTYIEYLDYAGLIGQEPFRNYLEKSIVKD